jgi:hypothetical protein
VKGCEFSCRSNFENSAVAESPALIGGSVEISVDAEYQARVRILAVRASETVEACKHSRGRDFEDSPVAVGATVKSRSIEVAVLSLHEILRERRLAVGSVEVCQDRNWRRQGNRPGLGGGKGCNHEQGCESKNWRKVAGR